MDETVTQEWTPEYVIELAGRSKSSGEGFKIIADAHNAALAAEQEKADNLFRVARKHSVENQELWEKVKTLVECLKRVRVNAQKFDQEDIDTALKKVKEGK